MNEIGKEYGAALFMLACEVDRAKEYGEALAQIRSAFSESADYVSLLASPGIPLSERLGVIDAVFASSVPEHVLSYLKLLCEKGRLSCFEEAYAEYTALLDASLRVTHARITSAVPMTDQEKESLVRKLEITHKGKVFAEYSQDPDILGGVIVEIDGKIMDGSLRHRLRDVKDVMNS